MSPSQPDLSSYSVQEIQLALIYGNRFNAFDGEVITRFLLEHQDLWRAVIMDHPYAHPHPATRMLLTPELFKLRDLGYSWHVDELFVLCNDEASREKLIALGEEKDLWELLYRYSHEELSTLFYWGIPDEKYSLFSVWWD